MQQSAGSSIAKHLEDVRKAQEALDGLTIAVDVDRTDPKSVEAARQRVEGQIDQAVARYSHNSTVRKIASMMKRRVLERMRLTGEE